MNYYFITGTSKGLGKSLLELLLKDNNNTVYGYSRTCTIEHSRYIHTVIDLSNLSDVQNVIFPNLENPEKIILINNAGMVGDVDHVGNLENQAIIDCYNLNLITPVILTNVFIKKYADLNAEKMILNISSGAGRSPIDGWGVYCSTKSGVDMFSEVLSEEFEIDNSNTKILSLAPGIIDTDMQVEIRKADKSGFSNVERFINYKGDGDLTNPQITAQQVLRFVNENNLQKNVICSVRDL